MNANPLFTDFYELTMAQGYWKKGLNTQTVFDMFFRRPPFGGGFSVFAGLDPLLGTLENLRFGTDDIEYLSSLGIFERGFLDYLSGFRFTGDVLAMKEGSLAFPNEPLVRVHANAIEASVIEGMLLNIVNFQTLIATKTARIWLASRRGSLMEFGLRRAQGFDGAMSASRAAYIGGAAGTSNALAGKTWGIPVMGTMAHAWVMSHPDEKTAFNAYAEQYPDKSVFLIDTYDTLGSGIEAAIDAGKKLAGKGKNFGVRLDSGDIQYLSVAVRKALDEAGLTKATITVSNELTEEIVESLVLNGSPIDFWGVGTHMVTGGSESSLTGVYKLSAKTGADGRLEPVMKLSENPEKATNPGIKQVWRLYNEDGSMEADILALEGEEIKTGREMRYFHPTNQGQSFTFAPASAEALLQPAMRAGKRLRAPAPLSEIRAWAGAQFDRIDPTYLRILNPHVYKVSLTENLRDMKCGFIAEYGRQK